MFLTLALLALFVATLLVFKARKGRGRISRLILWAFATAWSKDRLDRQAEARRRATNRR